MSKSKLQKEKEQFLELTKEMLHTGNLSNYLVNNSPEHLEGYKHAVSDILNFFDNHVLGGNPYSIKLYQQIHAFYNERLSFLNDLESLADAKVNSQSIIP